LAAKAATPSAKSSEPAISRASPARPPREPDPGRHVARRWLAGQVHEPLTSCADVLARAACAALSADAALGDAVSAPASRPGAGPSHAGAGRVTVELLDADGLVTGRGEATIRLAPT
jgi:hypothetical protein